MKLRNKKTGVIGHILTTKGLESYDVINDDYGLIKRYYSLPEVCDEWEDYKPAEPLIEDPKIRKAVRAWAEANGAWLLVVVSSYRIEISQVDAEIIFNDPVFKDLPRDRQLTIEELCGEGEE